jgi:hypothetical protein
MVFQIILVASSGSLHRARQFRPSRGATITTPGWGERVRLAFFFDILASFRTSDLLATVERGGNQRGNLAATSERLIVSFHVRCVGRKPIV